MPGLLDHLLVLGITVLLPVHDLLFWFPRLKRAAAGHAPRARLSAYRETIIIEWSLVALTLWLWASQGRAWSDLGFGLDLGWPFWLGAALGVTGIVLGTWQRVSLTQSTDEEVEEAVMAQLENLRPLLPHTPHDLRHFSIVSTTAGICEEILFRGFVIWYLSALVPTWAALFLSALLFGMAHAYQGARGVLQTGLIGLGLVFLYVLTGSLWIPMILHTFLDLNSGLLAYTFLRRRGARYT